MRNDLDEQEFLDREYSPSSVALRSVEEYITEYAEKSRRARNDLDGQLDLQYGDYSEETLDLFTTGRGGGPLQLFIHGGYWRRLGKEDFSYLAPSFIEAGINFAVLNYSLLPAVTIDVIVDQCRRSIAWLHQHARELNFDADSIHISGHSAGAHLCAMCLDSRWTEEFAVPDDLVKSACLVSGIYDLAPLVRVTENETWRFTPESAAAYSPMDHPPRWTGTELIITYGDVETAEFKRQSARYFELCAKRGMNVRGIPMPDQDHFTVISELADADSVLFRMVSDIMKSGTGRPAGNA